MVGAPEIHCSRLMCEPGLYRKGTNIVLDKCYNRQCGTQAYSKNSVLFFLQLVQKVVRNIEICWLSLMFAIYKWL